MEKSHRDVRHTLIEVLCYWQGLVNTTDLMCHFSISRTQALKSFKSYQQNHPHNLHYDNRLKGFIPTEQFVCRCSNDDVREYLDWLHLAGAQDTASHLHILTNASLCIPGRQVEPQVMRGLVHAIKHQKRVDVDYVSLAHPDGEGRIIQPHVFVKTALRWHLRAYDEKNKEFRDFVLSRFRGQPELLDNATHPAEKDLSWYTYIELILAPDSRLSREQRKVIEQDYQMLNGQLLINTRAALAQYLLQEMQINTKFRDEFPEAQQLVLVNKNDIKQWLFNA